MLDDDCLFVVPQILQHIRRNVDGLCPHKSCISLLPSAPVRAKRDTTLTSEKAEAEIFLYLFQSSCSEAMMFGPKSLSSV
jgi:hypothetical protein